MRTLPWLLGLIASAAVISTSGISGAQERPAADSPYEQSFVDHVARARAARNAGRWTEAEASYRAALGAAEQTGATGAERAEIAGELGLCELRLGKHPDAAEHLGQALMHRSQLSPGQRRRFDDGWSKAAGRVGIVYLSIEPSDAEVLVDGRSIGRRAPGQEIYLEPGVHTVRARLAGYADAENTIEAIAGTDVKIALRLPREPERPRAPPAPALPRTPIMDESTSSIETLTALRITGVAVAATGMVVGASFFLWGAVTDAEVEEQRATLRAQGRGACLGQSPPPGCTELSDSVDRRDTVMAIGWGTLIGGGVIGLITGGSLLLEGREPQKEQLVRVTPVTSGQQAGLVVHGTW